MKYMLLIHQGTALETQAALPQDQQQQVWADYAAINKTPGFTPGMRMGDPETATTVRVRNGKATITNGPFAETKEQLAGFYLVEARDLNEALQIAAKIPPAREGSIEVRPVRQLVP